MNRLNPLRLFIFLLLLSVPSVTASGAVAAKKFALQNGMTVIFLESHSLPMVQTELLVRGGSVLDPERRGGLSYLTAELLEEGTQTRSSREIAAAMDSIGTEFSANPGVDYATFSMKMLKKDLAKGMDLFSDIVTHPTFPEDELTRAKNELISHLADELDDPLTVAQLAFDKNLYGSHPYHRPVEGEAGEIRSISASDIRKFYDSYYDSGTAILVFAGDLTEGEARATADRYFGKWPARPRQPVRFTAPPGLVEPKVVLIDKDLAQTSVILGHLGIRRENPDYYPLQVMNYILGGGSFSSRMVTTIRENKGLVYRLGSGFHALTDTGSFEVSFQTKNRSANEAISEVLKEIRKMREGGVTDAELAEAKDYLVGSFPLKLDTFSKLSANLITQEYYHLGLDYFDKYTAWINRVSRQDVERVARTYLDPDHYLLVAVGKMSESGIDEKKFSLSGNRNPK